MTDRRDTTTATGITLVARKLEPSDDATKVAAVVEWQGRRFGATAQDLGSQVTEELIAKLKRKAALEAFSTMLWALLHGAGDDQPPR